MRRLSRIALSHVVLALALLAAPAAAYQAEVLARWRAGVLPTLDGIEPRRDGRAETWQRLYCLRWDDACVRCERARADEAPRCAPIDPGQPLEACQRQAIACEAEDFAVGPAVCQVSTEVRAIPSRTDPSVIASFARRTCNPGVCTGANFPTLDSLVEFDARVAENTPDMRRRFYEHHRPRPVPDVYCAFAKRDLSDPKE